MLFSKVFSWLRYKTLPPSTIARCRLIIERDSKHRRVTSNLGLTFRNSKWSTYGRRNVGLRHWQTYLRPLGSTLLFIAIFLAFLLLGIGLLDYPTQSFGLTSDLLTPLNAVVSFCWFTIDLKLYLSVAIWSLTTLSLGTVLSLPASSQSSFTSSNEPHFPRRLTKPLLCASLSQLPADNSSEGFFDSNRSSFVTLPYLLLLRKLYSVSVKLHASDTSTSKLSKLIADIEGGNCKSLQGHTSASEVVHGVHPSLTSLVLDYSTFQDNRLAISPIRSENRRWVTGNFYRGQSRTTEVVNQPFSLSSLTHSELNGASTSLRSTNAVAGALREKSSVVRWDRWLYKYSSLHSSSPRAAMDITRTQRLLSSGFYPTHFRTRNIWAASAFSQLPAAGPDLFTHTAQLAEVNSAIYGGYSSVSGNTSLSLPSTFTKPSLYPISAYGSSYGWTLRRLYHLNSLTVTGATLHPVPKQLNSSLTLSSTTPYDKSVTLSRRLASQVTRGPLTRDLNTQLSATSTLSAPALVDGHISYAQGSLFSLDSAETWLSLLVRNSNRSLATYSHQQLPETDYPKLP